MAIMSDMRLYQALIEIFTKNLYLKSIHLGRIINFISKLKPSFLSIYND